MEDYVRPFPSHSNSFGNNAEKDTAGCRALNRNSIVIGGLLNKIKPYGFTLFIKRYGIEDLLDCLEENEKRGILYHRKGIIGDYDDFDDVEKLIEFIKTGKR